MDDKPPRCKGIEIEFADCLIRISTAQALSLGLNSLVPTIVEK
jgi:hypothetical protein